MVTVGANISNNEMRNFNFKIVSELPFLEVVDGQIEVIPSKLPDEGYMHSFFPLMPSKDHVVSYVLEHLCFSPGTPLNDKFHMEFIDMKKDLKMVLWSFPKEYFGICQNIAKSFGTTAEKTSRYMINTKFRFHIPKAENLFIISSKRQYKLLDPTPEFESDIFHANMLINDVYRLDVD